MSNHKKTISRPMEPRNSKPSFKPKKSALIICLLLVASSLYLIKPVFSKTIRVGTTGPPNYDYKKIGDAAGNATAGDTIQVAPGIYYEHVIVDKSLWINGSITNPATTIVDGTGNGTVFQLKKGITNINITGFTIRNAGDNFNAIGAETDTSTTTKHNIIKNIITTSQYGVSLAYSDQNKIFNNTFINNALGAINLYYSKNNNVTTNTVTNSAYGIYATSSINNNITGNTITQTSYGISLTSSSNGNTIRGNVLSGKTMDVYSNSNNTIVHHNTIINGAYGIYFYNCRLGSIYYNTIINSSYGIRLYSSLSNNVNNNQIIAPNGWGIDLVYASGNAFTGNWLQTGSWGINMLSSSSNTIYHNNFMHNHVQAAGTGTGNVWDVNGEGNRWTDWNSTAARTSTVGTDNHPLKTTWSEHDVSVQSVTPSTSTARVGTIVGITVKVRNNANKTNSETFTVTTKYNSTIIGTQTVNPPLTQGTTRTLTFNWNTTGVTLGNYAISALAGTVPDELYTDNNNLMNGTVRITAIITGDINNDGTVNKADLTLLNMAYGSKLGDPNWNSIADLNNDHKIDVLDLSILGKNYGRTS